MPLPISLLFMTTYNIMYIPTLDVPLQFLILMGVLCLATLLSGIGMLVERDKKWPQK